MSFRDWASTTAGLVLASIGLTAFAMSDGGGEAAPAPATVAATVPQAPPATTETVVIETRVPQADVPGLSAAAARVLQVENEHTVGRLEMHAGMLLAQELVFRHSFLNRLSH